MAETETSQSMWNVAGFLESLSKATAALLFATYVSGFIVVSIHNASYGFAELSVFKPKIISAGALLLLFTVIPTITAKAIFNYRDSPILPRQPFCRAMVAALLYYWGCAVTALTLMPLYVPAAEAASPTKAKLAWLSWPLLIVAIVAYLATVSAYSELAPKKYEKHPVMVALLSIFLLVIFIVRGWLDAKGTPMSATTLWLFLIGVMAALIDHQLSDPTKRKAHNWTGFLFYAISALSLFSVYLYPHIKSSWGGGSPIPVVVYFSRESRVLPGQQMDGQLLDESDSGFYVTQRSETKALFIPRAAVSALYFSDKPLSPDLLK